MSKFCKKNWAGLLLRAHYLKRGGFFLVAILKKSKLISWPEFKVQFLHNKLSLRWHPKFRKIADPIATCNLTFYCDSALRLRNLFQTRLKLNSIFKWWLINGKHHHGNFGAFMEGLKLRFIFLKSFWIQKCLNFLNRKFEKLKLHISHISGLHQKVLDSYVFTISCLQSINWLKIWTDWRR